MLTVWHSGSALVSINEVNIYSSLFTIKVATKIIITVNKNRTT